MKLVPALLWAEHVMDIAESFEQIAVAAGADSAQTGFQFCECLLNRVQVW